MHPDTLGLDHDTRKDEARRRCGAQEIPPLQAVGPSPPRFGSQGETAPQARGAVFEDRLYWRLCVAAEQWPDQGKSNLGGPSILKLRPHQL